MNGETMLSEALEANAAVLDYIISLSPHQFERFRDPVLSKVLPAHLTLRRVAAMARVSEAELLAKVNELAEPPGEMISESTDPGAITLPPEQWPEWLDGVVPEEITWVSVTAAEAKLSDPMRPINIAISISKPGEIVGIEHHSDLHEFYNFWYSSGLLSWAKQINPNLWHIFVYRPKC